MWLAEMKGSGILKNSKNLWYNKGFSHIYVEDRAKEYQLTKEIIGKCEGARVISIDHYKDVFNRTNQDFRVQKDRPQLILAVKEGRLIYEGARVCQSFGQEHFYYTSCVMNCLYDCEYCYLQGMYPSGNIVLFVNLEDIFSEIERLLTKHPVYLCVSYDTDVLAMEQMTHMTARWIEFTRQHEDLIVEIRTKSANIDAVSKEVPCERVIFAWTLSPDEIIKKYERRTPGLEARIESLSKALSLGYIVRVCFDPVLLVAGYQEIYHSMIERVFQKISPEQIKDVSMGVFRISSDYLKKMREGNPKSVLVNYPFETQNNIASYGISKNREILSFMRKELRNYIEEDRIFGLDESAGDIR